MTEVEHVIVVIYIEHVNVKNAYVYYGPCDCFFDCIRFNMTTVTNFDIHFIRMYIKIRHNVDVPIRSITRFEKFCNTKIMVYKDGICVDNLVELHNNTFVSHYLIRSVLHNSHYHLYDGQHMNKST